MLAMRTMLNVCFAFRELRRLFGYFRVLPRCGGANTARTLTGSHVLCRKSFRSPVKFTKLQKPGEADVGVEREEEDLQVDEESSEIEQLLDRTLYIQEIGHQVFVIQPYVKWGREKKKLTTPELQLDEAVTLVKTLRNWKVVDKMIIPLEGYHKPRIFGVGQLGTLRERIRSNSKITAVFVSVNMLKAVQQQFLQEIFGVPVYDRYTVVIHIFRSHATTREAKLQIKLAELPYLWSRLKGIKSGSLAFFGGGSAAIGATWKGKQFHMQLLRQREAKVKEQIRKLRLHRQNIRQNRAANEIPIVAVVGYTNSGKTTLIKTLTKREKLQPKNYLFATLDVTVHEGELPSSMKVLYVDTIGFISDIPTMLFESFVVTLEDACSADVIIHVRDVSHADWAAQDQNVRETLELLDLPEKLLNNMITVGNKIDLVSGEELKSVRDENMILISAKNQIGTDILLNKIEEYVLRATDRKVMVMKVKTGGEEYCWLMENAVVVSETPVPDNVEYMLVKVIMTDVSLARFKHIFIKDYFTLRNKG